MNKEEHLEILLGAKKIEFVMELSRSELINDIFLGASVKITLLTKQIPYLLWQYLVDNNIAMPPEKRFIKDNFITLNIPIDIKITSYDTDNIFNIRYDQNDKLTPLVPKQLNSTEITLFMYDINGEVAYQEKLEKTDNDKRSK